jgi:hypothetical protein
MACKVSLENTDPVENAKSKTKVVSFLITTSSLFSVNSYQAIAQNQL